MPSAPKRWLHGTNSRAATRIVSEQELHGSGDFGDGGYVTSDPDWAKEHGQALVEARLNPTNPYFGGERESWDHPDFNGMLREKGHDVWFPTDDKGDDPNKHNFAVILDSRSATFHQATKPR